MENPTQASGHGSALTMNETSFLTEVTMAGTDLRPTEQRWLYAVTAQAHLRRVAPQTRGVRGSLSQRFAPLAAGLWTFTDSQTHWPRRLGKLGHSRQQINTDKARTKTNFRSKILKRVIHFFGQFQSFL